MKNVRACKRPRHVERTKIAHFSMMRICDAFFFFSSFKKKSSDMKYSPAAVASAWLCLGLDSHQQISADLLSSPPAFNSEGLRSFATFLLVCLIEVSFLDFSSLRIKIGGRTSDGSERFLGYPPFPITLHNSHFISSVYFFLYLTDFQKDPKFA